MNDVVYDEDNGYPVAVILQVSLDAPVDEWLRDSRYDVDARLDEPL